MNRLPRQRVICIDFDGVIYQNMKYQGTAILNGSPVPGVVAALEELSKTSKIIINSSRFEVDEGLKAVREWMINNGMDYELSKYKPTADIYVDDRGVCFNGDWQATIEEIKGFRQWQAASKSINRMLRSRHNRRTRSR